MSEICPCSASSFLFKGYLGHPCDSGHPCYSLMKRKICLVSPSFNLCVDGTAHNSSPLGGSSIQHLAHSSFSILLSLPTSHGLFSLKVCCLTRYFLCRLFLFFCGNSSSRTFCYSLLTQITFFYYLWCPLFCRIIDIV